MKKLTFIICMAVASFNAFAQDTPEKPLRIIAIGAHPDDCDMKFGGTAALYAQLGHKVKFLALTNGDAGHQSMGGGVLGKRRRAEAKKAGEALGIEYDVLDNHDAELIPNLNVRHQVIRKIREWDADIVLGLRPNDYHPDHRNAGIVVQDAAYLVIVPNVTPDTPALKKNPIFLYMQDGFQKPYPFSKDIAVVIDGVMDKKEKAFASHESQVFEWMPWLMGMTESDIPTGEKERLSWVNTTYLKETKLDETGKATLKKWYPETDASKVKYVEFFEICEYGKQPTDEEIKYYFPMLN
ncbi:PIG-L deacetylase family protein [Formosa algae]|uniref:LmbE family N-acetylglucosaminyl deacetylase n=2 Tax=Formosa algae TaxID=225843 RepID=A0A9X0YJT6_9FLAO|nr:PIG-L deacetylase family protein [Formosa algae]MBP1839890.1 LmbE family N-acetylglucosaminyl deacetylase [Formosa algae]MDQ0335489.1 LmbE family N-acetylglucosaminyl deacetylase [Formosa algae]OEI81806.1 GlcNAc-PI de-N-acetylase [Formosa algae]